MMGRVEEAHVQKLGAYRHYRFNPLDLVYHHHHHHRPPSLRLDSTIHEITLTQTQSKSVTQRRRLCIHNLTTTNQPTNHLRY